MAVEFGGSSAGSSVFKLNPDGTFSSETELLLGTMRIAEQLTGRIQGSRVVAYRLEAERPGQPKATLVYEAGKLKVVQGETEKEAEIGELPELLFSNLHPQLLARTLAAVDWEKKEPQELEVYMIDGGTKVKVRLTPLEERSTPRGTAKLFKAALGSVEVEYALDSAGRVVSMDVPAQRIRLYAIGWEALFRDPLADYPELSQPVHEVKVERGVAMKTRDGVTLVADVFRPDAPGRFPVILSRTPYGRATAGIEGPHFARRGYVFVAQDVRGMGDSGGEWDPFVNERRDGFDAVDWASKAPWSDGKVGMIGASYGGLVQWAAAAERHPALRCLIPQVSPPDAMHNIPYDHGTFFLFGNVWWARIVRSSQADLGSAAGAFANLEKLATLPLSKVDDAVFGENLPFFDRWLEREGLIHWKGFDWLTDLRRVDIPALHISGWWDGDGIGTKLIWETMRGAKRTNQWLIYGPWTHAFNTTRSTGDVDYGPEAILELDSLYLRWFDTWLKGKDVGLNRVPRARIFVTGANKWLDLDDWPEPAWAEQKLFLYADAPANGKSSRGELRDAPAKSQEPSRYLFNPANADLPEEIRVMDPSAITTVIKIGEKGPDDDALVFRTSRLSAPLTIAGPISLDLHFETTARDTDFYVMVFDEDPEGVKRMIGMPGKLRAAFLGGMDRPRPLVPNRPYRASIALWDTAHEFKPGHRLGIMIASGQFPMFARNLGTGEPIKDATRMIVQVNTIHHSGARPSALRFRVIPNEAR
jgi:uncharacterized protein